MEKISGVYKITNKITGEFYIGSSKNIKERWAHHKSPSTWKDSPGMLLYKAFQQYGLDIFDFEIIEKTDDLKNREQYFIGLLKPTYNTNRAFELDLDRHRSSCKKSSKKYQKSEKGKNTRKKYFDRLCKYNGETLTLNALRLRFRKQGIYSPFKEARKYLIEYN